MKNNRFGFILIDKESGPTSHDIVDKLRRIAGIKKIGHAGTLDPFASGLLILAVGREATKMISKYVKMAKEYEAEIFLGAETDTYDRTGKIIKEFNKADTAPQPGAVKSALKKFEGELEQVPPMYSARKFKGRKLYELARRGEVIQREPSRITIYKIDAISYKYPILKIRVKCSSGTYIRSLAYDIGVQLGTSAYLKELRRNSIGDFNVRRAVRIIDLNADNWAKYLFI